jgi:DUF4097 and DUF4098 domain-containing protein YvlB
MESQSYKLGANPRLVFRSCAADLTIEGGDGLQVQLQYPERAQTVDVRESEGALEIHSAIPLSVTAPVGTIAVVESCAGDLRCINLDELHINKHSGDVSAKEVSRADIVKVNGDVSVHGGESLQVTTLNGDLSVWTISAKAAILGVRGDVLIKGTEGQASLHGITGDVAILEPGGGMDARDVNGDIQFLGIKLGGECSLEANGDVAIYLEDTVNAHLELDAPLGRIVSSLELSDAEQSAHRVTGNLGAGAVQLKAVAHNGDIRLGQKQAGKVPAELDMAFTRAEREAEQAMRKAEKREDKARRRAERLEEKARLRAERLEEKARRRSERAAARAQKRAADVRRWHVKWGTPQAARQADNMEEERLAVLRMLAEGKVNAQQAEALLEALEG